MTYAERIIEQVKAKNAEQPEFIQAATEILGTLQPALDAHPEFEEAALLERIDRARARHHVPRAVGRRLPARSRSTAAIRVQYNSAIGPYKGGLRFHPTVNLGMRQVPGLRADLQERPDHACPWAAARAAPTSTPRASPTREVMRFCQSFMTELYRHIGPDTDVPAGDLGVGGREIGYLFGQYKRLRNEWTGVLTGKGLTFGGSLARTEATGYGLCYFADEYLKANGDSLRGQDASSCHGSGNVAIYAVPEGHPAGRQGHGHAPTPRAASRTPTASTTRCSSMSTTRSVPAMTRAYPGHVR